MSEFVQKLRRGIVPTRTDYTNHLIEFHAQYTGVAEDLVVLRGTTEGKSSYKVLLDAVPDPSGKAIVDLASGSGPLTELSLKRVGPLGKVITIDISLEELHRAQARANCQNGFFIQATAQSFPLIAGCDCMYGRI